MQRGDRGDPTRRPRRGWARPHDRRAVRGAATPPAHDRACRKLPGMRPGPRTGARRRCEMARRPPRARRRTRRGGHQCPPRSALARPGGQPRSLVVTREATDIAGREPTGRGCPHHVRTGPQKGQEEIVSKLEIAPKRRPKKSIYGNKRELKRAESRYNVRHHARDPPDSAEKKENPPLTGSGPANADVQDLHSSVKQSCTAGERPFVTATARFTRTPFGLRTESRGSRCTPG